MRDRQSHSALPYRATAAVLACIACGAAQAASVTVGVLDQDGAPVPDVAVYAVPEDRPAPPAADPPPHAIMDQVDLEFVPHILVVQTGTVIEFPNSDNVNHHVYSFSEAKSFELPLYKGRVYPPLEFEKSGIVTLGCNIHDNMLGYIFVVDTPWFAKTDAAGQAKLDAMPAGRYLLHVWTPRIGRRDLPSGQEIDLRGDGDGALSFRIEGKLFPPHGQDGSLKWSTY